MRQDLLKIIKDSRDITHVFILTHNIDFHLLICTPYFDRDAEALRAVAKGFGAQRSTLMVQNGYTNLQADAADALDESITLKSVKFEHREMNPATGMEEVREARLHAKFYALQSGDEVIVFAGSANPARRVMRS
jgi:hypothetical protein